MAQKLRPYQLDADAGVRAAFRRGAKRVLLVMPTGCHAKDQGILMYDGSIKMVQDVRVGDLVMGWDSTARRVTDLHRGRDEMFRVSPVKGRPFIVNRGHVLSLMTTGGRSTKKGAVVDVTVSEWLLWSKYKKHTHKVFRASADFPKHDLPITIDPYFLGVLIGDGSLINRVSVCKPDPEIRAEVDRQAAAYGLECKFYASRRASSSTQVISAKDGSGENYFRRELFRLGLMNKRSGEKFIPPQYKMGCRNTRLSVLAGIIDTDGHLSNGSYDYISKSEMLADDVCFVARSLGLAAYKKVCTKRCQGGFSGTYYRVSISGDCSIIPCRIPRKVAKKRRQIKNHLVSGFSVESVGVGDYYGFTIDGDGRYLMDDFTVTHNSGKTTTFAHWLMGAVAKGSSAIFLAHRRELISQASQRLTQHGVRHAVIQAGSRYEPNAQVQVASVQSLIPKLFPADPETAPDRPRADVLVFDEAHRSTSASYKKIIEQYPHAYVIGLTATAARTDGAPLGDVYQALVEVIDVADLIDQGYLCDYRIFEGEYEAPDEGLEITANGEFDEEEAAKRIDTDKLVGDVYVNWKKYADGKRTIIFAQSRKHAKHILEVFLAAGEKFVYVDGTTKNAERDKAGEDLAAGRITGIVNVQVYVEGFDVPLLECVVLAFMTASIIKYRQAVGRALRPAEGKTHALILDHGGNARHRFGGPDAPHEWSLDGRKKREQPVQPSLTTCPQCLAIVTSRMRICPDCEYVLAARAPKSQTPDTTDGMLVEGNYKIRGSEREERRLARIAALSEKERRAAEREEKRMQKAAAEAAKLARIEDGKKFLREAIALAQRKGYNFKYPLMKLKERFGSGEKSNFQWNQFGVSVKRERQWVIDRERLGGGNFRHVIISFEFEGVVYGAQTAE